MILDVIEKYLNNKKKCICEYSLLFSRMITLKNNKVYTNRKTFISFINPLIDYYVDIYYSSAKKTFSAEELKDVYLNVNQKLLLKDLDDLNYKFEFSEIYSYIMYCVVKNYDKDVIQSYINEFLLISVILWGAINLNDASSTFGVNRLTYKEISKKIFQIMGRYKEYKLCKNKSIAKNFTIQMKTMLKNDNTFFNSLITTDCYNKYIKLGNKGYIVKFFSVIEQLDNYSKEDKEMVFKGEKFNNKMAIFSMFYISVVMLKQLLINNNVDNFYIPFVKDFWSNKGSIDKFNKLFNKKVINKVIILFEKKDVDANLEIIKKMKLAGINVMAYEVNDQFKFGSSFDENQIIYRKNEV